MLRLLLVLTALLGCAPNRLEAQQTENENLRARLAQPLVAPKPLLFWVERMSHLDADVRQEAIEFLSHEVEGTGLFDPMLDEDGVERRSAFRSQARSVLPLLLHQLRNGDILLDNLEESDSPFFTVISILMAMGADAEAAIPNLKAIALDETKPYGARHHCVMALLYVTPEREPVGPLFLRVLESVPAELKTEFTDAYQREKNHTAGEPDGIDYLGASVGIVSTYFTMNLIHTGHTKSEVPTLVKIVEGNYPSAYRAVAIAVLGELSFDARAAVPALRKQLKDDDPFIRECAVSSLLMIEKEESLIPELLPFLDLDDERRKEYEQELNDYFQKLREEQAKLRKDEPGDETNQWFLGELKLILKRSKGHHRRYAIQTLGHIGPNAKAALPELRKALHDPDEDTRRMAAEAIRKIESK